MSAPTEYEVQREAKRVLRRLASGATLAPRGDGCFALMLQGSVLRDAVVKVPVAMEFAKRGWLARAGENIFTLSESGAAWLARAQCPDGDPFARQHRRMTTHNIPDADGIEQTVEVNQAESTLAWMHSRKLIDAAQFEAGEKLRRDFTLAGLSPRLGVDLSRPVVSGGANREPLLPDMVIAAKQRFTRAMRAAGPRLCDLLYDVCCHLRGLESVERAQGWPRRSAKVVLQIALDRLAEHYGLRVTAPVNGAMRSWQAKD